MTDKIKSAIKEVERHKEDETYSISIDNCDFIIHSLNAWGEVLKRLKILCDLMMEDDDEEIYEFL